MGRLRQKLKRIIFGTDTRYGKLFDEILIVAIILQVFYDVVIAKIDNLVNQMENASNQFIEVVANKL